MTKTTKKYYIKTYGCQMNKTDSERLAQYYQDQGLKPAKNWQEADLIALNTCAVRKRAEDRARAFIHKIVHHAHQESKPVPQIIMTGCMLHHGAKKLLRMEPEINQVLPISKIGFDITPIREDKKHAFIPISTGCNSYCSYCIVPYARGREKSRPMADILQEIQKLAEQDYEEITLLGQNVNSYGLEKVGVSLRKMLMNNDEFNREDLPSNQSQYLKPKGTPPFVELLQKISQIKQIKIIRFLSANPWDFHDELIEEIGKNKKIDRFVHLPIQSGSNSVLHRMNRGYTSEKYERVVKKLRAADPNVIIGTDIIVGFPGETEEEFQETVELAKKIDWHIGFVAKYSPRPGTASAKLYEDDIPHQVKVKRFHILDDIINVKNLDVRPKIV